jgi:hypothetical protein
MALLLGVTAVLALLSLAALVHFPPNWLFVYLFLLSLATLVWLVREMRQETSKKGKKRT